MAERRSQRRCEPPTKAGRTVTQRAVLAEGLEVSVCCGLRVFGVDGGWIRRRRCASRVAPCSRATAHAAG